MLKKLTSISLLLISPLSFSFDICELDSPSLHSFEDELIGYSSVVLEEVEFNKIIGIRDFKFSECKDSISLATINLDGDVFKMYYTNEDHCDGGNSYGSVLNNKNEVIAAIADGEVYCD